MIENKDSIIKCPKSGGDLCYLNEVAPNINHYMSLSSGFWTNSLCKKGTEFYKEQFTKLPDLYKKLEWEDPETKLVWFPNTISLPKIGMVFANGTSETNWGWSAVKAVPVKDEEKTRYPIPGKKGEYYEMRMAMETIMNFDKNNYMDALSYLGILPE